MEDKFTGSKAFLNIPVEIARGKDLLKNTKYVRGEFIGKTN